MGKMAEGTTGQNWTEDQRRLLFHMSVDKTIYLSIRSFDGYWLKNSLESGSQGRGDYRAKLDRRSKKIYFIRGWTKTMYLSIQSFDG